MLIEFEVGNYLSFKAPVRLDMRVANADKKFLEENTFQAGRYRLLKSAAIYGANASGKSNLIHAMLFMRGFVLHSSKLMQGGDEIPVTPFKLDAATENAPSHFEICFLQDRLHYRYGFEVDKTAVRKEWLFCAEKEKETALFLRDGDGIDVSDDFAEGKGFEKNTRDNALFLSLVAQLNGPTAGSILQWFSRFGGLHGLQDRRYEQFTAKLLDDVVMRPLLVEFIRRADVGIDDLLATESASTVVARGPLLEDVERWPGASGLVEPDLAIESQRRAPKERQVSTVHPKFRDGIQAGVVKLDFSREESEGTRQFFRLAGPLLDCLKNGHVVAIDELDAKLHPLLTRAVVRLFNSAESNPKNAQLIFATHDTSLLQYGEFRRDQIWFVEKTQHGATDLYSLAEIKVRNDAAYEKNYIQGRYGAIPFLGDLEALLKEGGDGAPREVK